jgi:riboflavin kinase / FMN adenylyltransferase
LKTYQSIPAFSIIENTIITIGTFDGVHIGHKKILEKVVAQAKEANLKSVVLTFFPHPRMVLQEKSEIKLLNTIQEKISLLEKLEIDHLVIHPFDYQFSRLSAEDFVKSILVDTFKIKKIIIGHDHRFGRNRTANIDDLMEFGEKYNFEVEQITAEEINEIAISSTKIRNAISDGNIDLANQFLGYNYSFSGMVTKGKQIGRTIGFPTANIAINEDYKLIPKNGVYVVKSFLENQVVFGMMNIGNRPTLNGENQTIEVHFFNFNKEIYDLTIEVSLLHFIREEQKFSSLDQLKSQIAKDQIFSLDYISKL